MTKSEAYSLLLMVMLALSVILSVYLIRRAKPEKRFFWFLGVAVLSVPLFGLLKAPVVIVLILAILAFMKKEDDNPLSDVFTGGAGIFAMGFGFGMYGLMMLIGLGDLYWLWMAIQLKSFGMFVLGIFPIAWIVTGPVGAYALLFEAPAWITNTFGS